MTDLIWRAEQPSLFIRQYGTTLPSPARIAMLMLALDLLCAWLLMPYLSLQMAERFALNPTLDAAALPTATWVAMIFSALTPLLILLFVSFLLLLAILIFDGSVRFSKLFSVLLYSSLPSLLVRLQCAGFYAAGWSTDPNVSWTSIGYHWLPQPDSNLMLALSRLDLLEVFTFVLVVIGVRNVSTLTGRSAWLVPLVIWGGLQLVYWRALSSAGGL